MEEVKMDIFVPIDIDSSIAKSEESEKVGTGEWYVRGYASTPHLDLQGDIVQPAGIDIDYFVKSGWINYEHKQDAKYVVGVPTDNCHVDFRKGLFVEARLLKDNPYAQEMWDLANSIKKSGVDRKIGFSIEGVIKKRNDRDNRIVEELTIRNVALTKNPANPHATWETFMKSWTTGHEVNPTEMSNASALRTEQLAQAITTLTHLSKIGSPQEKDRMWSEATKYLEKAGRRNEESDKLILQLARGVSRKDASEFVNKLYEKGANS